MGRHTELRCEAVVGWNETTGGHPILELCPQEATRFFPKQGPMAVGMWLCDEHKLMGLAKHPDFD